MQEILPIPLTLGVVVECWDKAESELRKSIKQKHQDADEEFITRLFLDEFRYLLRKASANKRISQAFLKDLQQVFPELAYTHEIAIVSEDLIADVSLHRRSVEKLTGGDFGLTITRPQVSLSGFPSHSLSYNDSEYIHCQMGVSEYQRGLLCQAKLKGRDGRWGKLTRQQKSLLPDRINYFGLLLYQYSDKERYKLSHLSWLLCQNETAETVNDWLKSGKFSSISSSAEIITQLGNARIGTDNPDILREVIRPTGRPYIVITISWPDDKRPPDSVPVYLQNPEYQENQQQRIHVLVRTQVPVGGASPAPLPLHLSGRT
jgi:hypothetical protein